jgi:hypothetical protein
MRAILTALLDPWSEPFKIMLAAGCGLVAGVLVAMPY